MIMATVSNSMSTCFAFSFVFLLINSCYGQVFFPFGDSNYDVGNKLFLTNTPVASRSWPYGLSVDKPTGRWSDGRIVPDFISEFLGIPNIPPALDPKANTTNGLSFATTDATVLGAPFESLSLPAQVEKFNQLKGAWTSAQREAALYLFYIGADDYLNYTNTHKSSTLKQQEDFVNQVVSVIEKSLRRLYNLGARKIGFQNLAPLGCLPIVKQQYESGTKCVDYPSAMAALHNKKLLQTLDKLEKTLPGFHFAIYDYYTSILRRIADVTNYRYFSADMSCCGVGSHNAFGCGFRNIHSNLCSYQRGYLFWDGRHNAEKSNEAVAHMMFSSDPEVIQPINLRELFVLPANISIVFSDKI